MFRKNLGRGSASGTQKQRARVRTLMKASCELLEVRRLFAFGLTTTTSSYTVDTGAGLVFSILRGGTLSSTIHLGDMTSAVYNGVQTLAPYSSTSRYSHYEQGLGSNASIGATVDPNGQWIMITCDDSAETSGAVIQYYIAKKGEANIYMASLPLDVNNGPGEGRYLAYMNRSVFTNIENPSDISMNNGAVEGSDVYHNADGTTYSKFYNMGRRMIDNSIHGISGTNIGAFMTMGNRETSSGGPFFKDIDFQTTSAATEMYNCLFTGHTQTELYRQGLKGPYAMMFTTGAQPALPDYSWMDSIGIPGLVPASGRGSLSGTETGVSPSHQAVVGLSNSTAQYWAYANSSTGAYSITGILPGTYTETLYDTEMGVGTKTVTITAAAATSANVVDTCSTPASPVFTIGTWDGTPGGFLNDDKISIMHPSDVRMTPWTNVVYTIGTNVTSDWPLVQFKAPSAANNPNLLPALNPDEQIVFNLTSAQAAQAMTLRIGITLAFAGGRPIISVNGGSYSAAPSPSAQPDSRGITRGTWRGNNTIFTYSINANTMHSGSNTIDIGIASGSYDLYSAYLQPSATYDAIDLVPTSSITNTPHVQSVTVTPGTQVVAPGGQQTYTASAKDQFGNPIITNFNWSTTAGTVNPNGTFTAPTSIGTDTITATSGSVTGTASATVNTIVGTSGNDTISLVRSGANLVVTTNGSSYSVLYSSLGAISVAPGTGTDSINIDFSGGATPVPPAGLTITGGGGTDTLIVTGTTGNDSVSINANTVTFNSSPISYSGIQSIIINGNGGSDVLTQTAQPGNAASLVFNGITSGGPTATDTLNISSGAYTFAAPAMNAGIGAISLASLFIGSSASVSVASALATTDRWVLVLGALTLTSAGSQLDLGGNDLIVHNTGSVTPAQSLANITAELKNGFNASGGVILPGPGIISTVAHNNAAHLTALGVAVPIAAGTFDGQNISTTDVLVKYTYFGDAALIGKVDGSNYSRIDNGFLNHLTGWFNGDFNYDGTVNGSDYTLIDNAYNRQGASLAAAVATQIASALVPSVFSAASPISLASSPNGSIELSLAEKDRLESLSDATAAAN